MTIEPVTFLGRVKRDRESGVVIPVSEAARRMSAYRVAASADFPLMEEMRDRAREVRLHTLANLDKYLAQFASQVEANGGQVHWAADGHEANAIIRQIADNDDVRTVVKSKSMVTEEIELNESLEAAGLSIVETDLGEFIVQLSGDKPSHIIAPVLHKTRYDIGELFAEKLDRGFSTDPAELTQMAREHLRREFLTADMGISGCNMAIADTGTVVLVTNEGNGRLTTTAPRIHVTVMGMERIVPTFGDASAVLEVLARAGTGQRLSVYTNFVSGPRRHGDPDGPDAFHVVILDNGRSRTLGGQEAEILACIRCGACLNICPVYREVGGHAYGFTYPGPIGAVVTPSLKGLDEWHELPYASTLCGACVEACPVRIDIPKMLLTLRSRAATDGHLPGWLTFAIGRYATAATHPRQFRLLLKAGGVVGSMMARDGWISKAPSHGANWTGARDLPQPAKKPFHARWKARHGA
jgi:L-lactate dehydrogenase complex protein LldF